MNKLIHVVACASLFLLSISTTYIAWWLSDWPTIRKIERVDATGNNEEMERIRKQIPLVHVSGSVDVSQ